MNSCQYQHETGMLGSCSSDAPLRRQKGDSVPERPDLSFHAGNWTVEEGLKGGLYIKTMFDKERKNREEGFPGYSCQLDFK